MLTGIEAFNQLKPRIIWEEHPEVEKLGESLSLDPAREDALLNESAQYLMEILAFLLPKVSELVITGIGTFWLGVNSEGEQAILFKPDCQTRKGRPLSPPQRSRLQTRIAG